PPQIRIYYAVFAGCALFGYAARSQYGKYAQKLPYIPLMGVPVANSFPTVLISNATRSGAVETRTARAARCPTLRRDGTSPGAAPPIVPTIRSNAPTAPRDPGASNRPAAAPCCAQARRPGATDRLHSTLPDPLSANA